MFSLNALRAAVAAAGLVALSLTGCQEKELVAPRPLRANTGTLEGRLQPLGTADSILLYASGGRHWSVAPDERTGLFRFSQLLPGEYTLSAIARADYEVTSAQVQTLRVKIDDTTRTTLTLPLAVRIRGTISWDLNGVSYSVPATYAEITPDKFILEGHTLPNANHESHSVALVISEGGPANAQPFTGAGTYGLGQSVYPYARYNFTRGVAFDEYTTMYTFQPVGTITVSQFDMAARTAAGRFEFVAARSLNGTGTTVMSQTITNGRFDITF
ncbi:hypothetical protein [Hymenobacter sediminicola]|uniref:Uncharacterized protein n=1 Tax=Hymenobacter sediminicola TaxID=2761579 RepID=A0A7G7W404_9BACT|nr:hypothetical protein [Hymenobacter sediminicola]QNH61097.1 hypothetical protein H4317_13055 [Hymenobacter sediminicola]